MNKLKKILTVLSMAALPLISQASSMNCGTPSDVANMSDSNQGDVTYLVSNHSMGDLFTQQEQTIEYLLERHNRNQLDEILTLLDSVMVTQ